MVFDRIGLVRKLISSYLVTIQYRSKHMLPRPYEYDSIVQNPISEADFKWILHRNCEGTEQLRSF